MSTKRLDEMLNDRAFVEYFNLFMCQPVFGYGIIYKFPDKHFVIDSRLKRHLKSISAEKLQEWIEAERYPCFFRTRFYHEYDICTKLRTIHLNKYAIDSDSSKKDTENFNASMVEKIFGHYVGMLQFKVSLLDTAGEKVWRCLQDVNEYCSEFTDETSRKDLHQHLKLSYFVSGAMYELCESTKLHFFLDNNLEDEMETGSSIVNQILFDGVGYAQSLFNYNMFLNQPYLALLQLRKVLLNNLLYYWAPRFVLHVDKVMKVDKDIREEVISSMSQSEGKGDADIVQYYKTYDSPIKMIYSDINKAMSLGRISSGELQHSGDSIEVVSSELLHCQRPRNQRRMNGSHLPPIYTSKAKKLSLRLKDYLFGNTDISTNLMIKLGDMIVTVLSSDRPAGQPFYRDLLVKNESAAAITLHFWNDICNYIMIDSTYQRNYRDVFKKLFENRIKKIYLNQGKNLLTEKIKLLTQTCFNQLRTMSNKPEIHGLLEVVYQVATILRRPWKEFIKNEKHTFLKKMKSEDPELSFDTLSTFDSSSKFSKVRSISSELLSPFDKAKFQEVSLFCMSMSNLKHQNLLNMMDSLRHNFPNRDLPKLSPDFPKYKNYLPKEFYEYLRPKRIDINKLNVIQVKKHIKPVVERKESIFPVESSIANIVPPHKIKMAKPYVEISTQVREIFVFANTDRKRNLFRKHLQRLCHLIREITQPHTVYLLSTYADYLAKKQADECKEQSNTKRKKTDRYFNRSGQKSENYTQLKNNVLFLSESLRYKLLMHDLLKSGHLSTKRNSLKKLAHRIVHKYIGSDSPLKVQLSIPQDLALSTEMEFKREGATRRLFHEMNIEILPSVYKLWLKLGYECISCGGRRRLLTKLNINDDFLDKLILKAKKEPIYEKLAPIVVETDTSQVYLSFNLQFGLRELIPRRLMINPEPSVTSHLAYSEPDLQYLRRILGQRGGSQLEFVLIK